MEKILFTVEAYLNTRTAILRALEDKPMSQQAAIDLLETTPSVIQKRRKDAKSWRPNELIVLGESLRVPTGAIGNLRSLVMQLTTLPETTLRPILKSAHLDRKKLVIRSRDYEYWQHDELHLLASALRNWKPTVSTPKPAEVYASSR